MTTREEWNPAEAAQSGETFVFFEGTHREVAVKCEGAAVLYRPGNATEWTEMFYFRGSDVPRDETPEWKAQHAFAHLYKLLCWMDRKDPRVITRSFTMRFREGVTEEQVTAALAERHSPMDDLLIVEEVN